MAAGITARGLVIYGSDHADGLDSFGRGGITNPGSLRRLVDNRPIFVARSADFVRQIRKALVRLLTGISREDQAAFTIEHTDSVDTFLIRDRLHDVVFGLAVVVEHELPGGAGNAARQFVRPQNHRLYQLLFLRAEVQVAGDTADRNDEDRQRDNQLGAKFSWH